MQCVRVPLATQKLPAAFFSGMKDYYLRYDAALNPATNGGTYEWTIPFVPNRTGV